VSRAKHAGAEDDRLHRREGQRRPISRRVRNPRGSQRRVLALTFGPDFIHWRRSGESWPSVWPGRRLFFLRDAPAPAGQVWGRFASSGLATSPTGARGRRRRQALIESRVDWVLDAAL
jgi:hypothetical protein